MQEKDQQSGLSFTSTPNANFPGAAIYRGISAHLQSLPLDMASNERTEILSLYLKETKSSTLTSNRDFDHFSLPENPAEGRVNQHAVCVGLVNWTLSDSPSGFGDKLGEEQSEAAQHCRVNELGKW